MIYEAFGWEAPKFGHMSLIISKDTGKKLSKRDESVIQFIEQYRDLGYLPAALLNSLFCWAGHQLAKRKYSHLKNSSKCMMKLV